MNSTTIVPETAPAVQELFDSLDRLEPGYRLELAPGDPFYMPGEDIITRYASEMISPDRLHVGYPEDFGSYYNRVGEKVRVKDAFPAEADWAEATRGVRLDR